MTTVHHVALGGFGIRQEGLRVARRLTVRRGVLGVTSTSCAHRI